MSDAEKANEWVRFYQASPEDYRIWALGAVLKNDGEAMLARVLRQLKLETPMAVVKSCVL